MSHRRKHVTSNAKDWCPAIKDNQKVLRVAALRGSNLVEVDDADGANFLVRMPQKFVKVLWVKKGSFLIAELPEVPPEDDVKVRGEVVAVLFDGHVKELRKNGLWPAQFDAHLQAAEAAADAEQRRARSPRDGSSDEGSDGDDDGMPPLERNPNRKGWSEDEENTSEDYTTTSGEETENDGAGAEGAAGGDGDGGSGATGAVKGAGHVGAGGAGGETSGPSAAAAGVGGLSLKS